MKMFSALKFFKDKLYYRLDASHFNAILGIMS